MYLLIAPPNPKKYINVYFNFHFTSNNTLRRRAGGGDSNNDLKLKKYYYNPFTRCIGGNKEIFFTNSQLPSVGVMLMERLAITHFMQFYWWSSLRSAPIRFSGNAA